MKSRICHLPLLLLLVLFAWQFAEAGEQIQLVGDSVTNYRIMLGPGASPIDEFAAQELQGYVMQISNVFLPMASRNEPVRGKLVLVGNRAAARLGINVDDHNLGIDGFVIKTVDDKIVLAGGSPRGTLYSVYAFLEMLGCRWLAPGILGEVIPRRSEIVVSSIDHLERPDIAYRGFTHLIPVSYEGPQWIDWMAKNRMNYFMVPQSNYDDFRQILAGELERRGMDIGASFDGFMSADQILEFVSDKPEISIIAIYTEPMETEEDDDQYLKSIDVISRTVKENYPDKLVFLMKPGRIVSVDDPISRRCYRHSLDDENCEINCAVKAEIEDQLASRGRLHIHDYYMGSYSQNSLPFPILHTIASDIRYFNRLKGLDGVISQCEPGNWGTYGLNYYVFARLAWNPDSDLGSVVDDYCDKYYGPSSEPMKGYFAVQEDAMATTKHFRYVDPPHLILQLLDEKSLTEMEKGIANAEEIANDAMIFDRLRKVKLSLDHTKLLWNMLNHYFRALQFQADEDNEEAISHFQQTADVGEKLVAFLFQNIEEGIYIIPESYIFDYIEPVIADARERKDSLDAE